MILMLGPPGAGKSVQSGLLAAEYGYIAISTGVLLRSSADPELKEVLLKGDLVDDELVSRLVKEELIKHKELGDIILDGFPRNVAQSEWLVKTASELGIVIECMLHITASLPVVKDRLLKRQRPDDEESVIEARYKDYESIADPIIATMVAADIPVMTVDGTQSIETVRRLIMAQMEHRKTT